MKIDGVCGSADPERRALPLPARPRDQLLSKILRCGTIEDDADFTEVGMVQQDRALPVIIAGACLDQGASCSLGVGGRNLPTPHGRTHNSDLNVSLTAILDGCRHTQDRYPVLADTLYARFVHLLPPALLTGRSYRPGVGCLSICNQPEIQFAQLFAKYLVILVDEKKVVSRGNVKRPVEASHADSACHFTPPRGRVPSDPLRSSRRAAGWERYALNDLAHQHFWRR